MIKVPYGISNFELLRKEGYHFVDRTGFIARLERLPTLYHFFLRPRRFGKSLWLSVLEYYYDQRQAEQFHALFGDLEIGNQPTPKANQYLVLALDFSGIDTSTFESVSRGFWIQVKTGLERCMNAYPQYFDKEDHAAINASQTPAEAMAELFVIASKKKKLPKIFLLIDEYDHFTNRLLVNDHDKFKKLVGRDGFYRAFFEAVKTGTQSGMIGRIFATGISPVTLDSLTSGFNIGHNLTLDLSFHDLFGFSESETTDILKGSGVAEPDLPLILSDVQTWYNGYLFNPRAKQRLYNPDMLFYFAREYQAYQRYPESMLDVNIASDYSRISQTFAIGNYSDNISVLQDLVEEKTVSGALTIQFSMDKIWTRDDSLSLLFYNGLITIHSDQLGLIRFQIPNQVILELYFKMFRETILNRASLLSDQVDINGKMVNMALQKDPRPFFEAVANVLKSLDNRDYRKLDEKHVKSIAASFLFATNVYFVRSEYPLGKGYIDLLLLSRPNIEVAFQYAFELKYVKKGDASQAPTVFSEARQQLKDYLNHPDLKAVTGVKVPLSAWIVLFVGSELYAIEELDLRE